MGRTSRIIRSRGGGALGDIVSCTVACANYNGWQAHTNPGGLFLNGERGEGECSQALGSSRQRCCLCCSIVTPGRKGSGVCDAPSLSTWTAKAAARCWLGNHWLLSLSFKLFKWCHHHCHPGQWPVQHLRTLPSAENWMAKQGVGVLTQNRVGCAEAADQGEASAAHGTLRVSYFRVDLR